MGILIKHSGALLFLLWLFYPENSFGYEILLKDGKVIKGTLVRESAETIIIKDGEGMIRNFKRSEIEKATRDESDSKPAKKNVVTQEQLEKLRDKIDLGFTTFKDSSELPEPKEEYLDQDSEFDEEVLESSVPVLVEFWASWCGPCRQMKPVIETISKEFAGEAKVYKVNVDIRRAITQRYKIVAIPTILFFRNGKVTDQIVGSVSKDAIAKKLRAQINNI